MLPGTSDLPGTEFYVEEDERIAGAPSFHNCPSSITADSSRNQKYSNGHHNVSQIARSGSFLGMLTYALHPINMLRHHKFAWDTSHISQKGSFQQHPLETSQPVSLSSIVESGSNDSFFNIDEANHDFREQCGRFQVTTPSTDGLCAFDEFDERVTSQENQAFEEQESYDRRFEKNDQVQMIPTFMDEDNLGKPMSNTNFMLIRFNVSGTPFLIRHATLQHDPYVFAKILEDAIWLPSRKEYYFERDPVVFRFIHNYLRLGEVHLPLGMCGPLVEKELDEWGIPLGLDIQRCCLGPVIDSKSKLESLQTFERKLEPKSEKLVCWIKYHRWQTFRDIMWNILEAPQNMSQYIVAPVWSKPALDQERENKLSTSSMVDSTGNTFTSNSTVPHQQVNDDIMQRRRVSWTEPLTGSCNSRCKPSKSRLVRWLHRGYLLYESLIITFAVLVFMLSTVPEMQVAKEDTFVTGSGVLNRTDVSYSKGRMGLIYLHESFTNCSPCRFPHKWLVTADIIFSTAITMDLVARMIFCPSLLPWMCSASTLIVVISLIPFYSEAFLYNIIYFGLLEVSPHAFLWLLRAKNYIAILKVFIVLRLFRVLKRHRSTRVLLYTIRTTFSEVAIIVVLILVSALFFGTAIYFTDDTFRDIPSGSWWALITMSTVGYGDLVPKGIFGYLVAMVCIIIGTLLMSYNIPILVNHFVLYYDHADQLHQVKQLHRSAKRKARRRRVTMGAERALTGARDRMWATWTRMNVNSTTHQVSSKSELVNDNTED